MKLNITLDFLTIRLATSIARKSGLYCFKLILHKSIAICIIFENIKIYKYMYKFMQIYKNYKFINLFNEYHIILQQRIAEYFSLNVKTRRSFTQFMSWEKY